MIDESLECKRCQNMPDAERIRLFSVNYTERPSGKVIGQRKGKLYRQGAFMVSSEKYELLNPIGYNFACNRESFRRTLSVSRVRENRMHGLMRGAGGWLCLKPASTLQS